MRKLAFIEFKDQESLDQIMVNKNKLWVGGEQIFVKVIFDLATTMVPVQM